MNSFEVLLDEMDGQIFCAKCGDPITRATGKTLHGEVIHAENTYACGVKVVLHFNGDLTCEAVCRESSTEDLEAYFPALRGGKR